MSVPGFPGDEEINLRLQRAFDGYIESAPKTSLEIVAAWITGSDRARFKEVGEVLEGISGSKLDLNDHALTDSIVDLVLGQRDPTEISLSQVTFRQLAKIAALSKLRSLESSFSEFDKLGQSITFPSLEKLKTSGNGVREQGMDLF